MSNVSKQTPTWVGAMGILGVLSLLSLPMGCGSAPWRGSPEPWERGIDERGLETGDVTLRRQHARGARYETRVNIEVTTVTRPFGDRGAPAAAERLETSYGIRWSDTIEPSEDLAFVVERTVQAATMRTTHDGVTRETSAEPPTRSGLHRITARNERSNAAPRSALHEGPADRFEYQAMPNVVLLLEDPFPNETVSRGSQWTHTREGVHASGDVAPTHFRFETTWRLHGVERASDGDHAHLGCEGTWRAAVDAEGPADSGESVTGRGEGQYVCAVRLSLADGHASRWRVDFRTESRVEGRRDGEVEGGYMLSSSGRALAVITGSSRVEP